MSNLAHFAELSKYLSGGFQREFGPVATGELREALRFVPVPPSQLGRWRSVPGLFVVIDRLLRLSAGPQSLDQHSIVVVLTARVIVGTDNLDGVLDHKWGLDLLATDH